MNVLRYVWCVLLALGLVACGGGGGPDTSVKVPTLSVSLVDATESNVVDRSLSATDARYIKVVLRTKSGAAAAYTPVSVTLDGTKAVLFPLDGQKFTDANGVALIKISPANPSQGFVLRVNSAATVDGTSLSSSIDLQYAGGSTVSTGPTLAFALVDGSGNALSSNSIGSGSTYYARATVKNSAGLPVANKLVSFFTDSSVATLAQSSVLTNSNGIGQVKITPASLTATLAASISATTLVDTVGLTETLDYQTSAADVTLTQFSVGQDPITALQSTAVSVEGRVNGVLAGTSAVSVSFSAGCGIFSPATALTGGDGKANSTYQAAANCAGLIVLAAQAGGGLPVTRTINVNPALAANVVFDSATVPLMVSTAAVSGLKQSTLKFKVVDSTGAAMPSQLVKLALETSTARAGVRFSIGGTSSDSEQTVTTDGNGIASITVTSGGLPTPVFVRATLGSNIAITASSIGVAVTSGRATQNAFSLSVEKYSIEAFSANGVQTGLTIRVADRQGNAIPPGAAVTFVASHGLVGGSCIIDVNSACSVTYTSQGLRPTVPIPGRAKILAYMDGEESFIDLDGDNIWQSPEIFFDLGLLYLDINENGSYDAGEQIYPGGATGTVCNVNSNSYPSASTFNGLAQCDGTWSNNVRLRQQVTIALATSEARVTLAEPRTSAALKVNVADLNGNSMPTGSTLSAEVYVPDGATINCAVLSISPEFVPNTPNAAQALVRLNSGADCLTARIDVSVTSPGGLRTIQPF